MNWQLTHRADPRAAAIADRHYSRQTVGSPMFTPPGRVMVLVTPGYDALWATSWPFAEYVHRKWADHWCCSLFRNEGPLLSSDLIREALAATRWYYGDNPAGMVTLVDTTRTRHKRDPGRCFRKAGFVPCGYTKGGLLALRIDCEDMPPAEMPIGAQMVMAV